MKKHCFIFLFIATAGFVVVNGCKSHSKTKSDKTVVAADNSQSSLDWDGIYRGVVPCADCEGIQKTIYLNRDLSYRIKVRYLGKQGSDKEYSGKFTWNDEGNTITLQATSDEPASYFVGENTLTQLDRSGNKITGDLAGQYILSKEQYAILEKYWKLTELFGKPVQADSSYRKEPHIIFRDSADRYSGNGGCNNFSGVYRLGSLNRITISPGITTRMACPRLETETLFFKALTTADNYTINGDMLVLNKARMAPLARFKTVYMK